MKNILVILGVLVLLSGCKKEAEVEFVYPKQYLPVYPGSFWDYTNGERSVVDPNYHVHWYEKAVNSTEVSSRKFVPLWDGKYVYEYSIYQVDPYYPTKELLRESAATWTVHKMNGEDIKRTVVSTNDSVDISLIVNGGYYDTTFHNVVTVIEYVDSLGTGRWNLKEYYAKGVGLVQTEVSDPFNSGTSVVVKKLQQYYINK